MWEYKSQEFKNTLKRLKTTFILGFKNKNNKRELNNRIKETKLKSNLRSKLRSELRVN